MRRPRGPGGRFLTHEELKAKDAKEASEKKAAAEVAAAAGIESDDPASFFNRDFMSPR
jgi:hypothetical protein